MEIRFCNLWLGCNGSDVKSELFFFFPQRRLGREVRMFSEYNHRTAWLDAPDSVSVARILPIDGILGCASCVTASFSDRSRGVSLLNIICILQQREFFVLTSSL
jgi:hypothetical protein